LIKVQIVVFSLYQLSIFSYIPSFGGAGIAEQGVK
jgi:hypothetical protein